jgi:hypothetical protein
MSQYWVSHPNIQILTTEYLGEHYNVRLEDKNRNLGCELSEQTASEMRLEEYEINDLLDDDNLDIDFDLFMGDDEEAHAAQSGVNQREMPFGSDEKNDEKHLLHDDEDYDESLANEQFHAQMEQSHEKQRQIQQQVRQQMSSANPAQAITENATKPINNASSNAEKINLATEKWEEDEPLGDKATKAAVLFSNLVHPELKKNYPQWSERVKRINNLWRKLQPDERDVYVKMARANRAEKPKPRNKRAMSSVNAQQANTSTDDVHDASQDSNHSHASNALEQFHPPPPQNPLVNRHSMEQVTFWY